MNDHVLKATWPGVVTGKISDFAGLLYFPLLLASLYEILRWPFDRVGWHATGPVVVATMAFTAIGFTLVKVSSDAAHFYVSIAQSVTGRSHRIVLDHTDLIALPMVLFAWPLHRHHCPTPERTSDDAVTPGR